MRADVSYFLCCTRKRKQETYGATKEIGDVCTQAILYPENVQEMDRSFEEFTCTRR